MTNLLLCLVCLLPLLMVGQSQVIPGSSCDSSSIKITIYPDVFVGQNRTLVRDGDVYEIDLVNQLEPKTVECRMKEATNVTLTCDGDSITKNESYIVEKFPLKNGTRCACSAQRQTYCFKPVTFTVQPKSPLSFAANGSKIQFNTFAGKAVRLECTIDNNNMNYNMTISDKYNSTVATIGKTKRIETTITAPAKPVTEYFCSASSGDVTLVQSIQLNIKPIIYFTATNKQGKKDIEPGDDVHFNCEIKGYPSSEISIRDMRTGKALPLGFKDEFRASAKEVFGCDTQHNSRLFECIVNNNALQAPVNTTLELAVHCMNGASSFFNPVLVLFFTIVVTLAGFW